MNEILYKRLCEAVPADRVLINEPMKKHTTFKVGGNADIFITIKKEEELKEVCKFAKETKTPIIIIGNGSNILVTDKGIRGIVAKIDIKKTEIKEEKDIKEHILEILKKNIKNQIQNKVAETAYKLQKEGITGFEELAGIPGTIGGAIRMNAGAYGKEMKDIVIDAKILNEEGKIETLKNEELKFEYRNSIISQKNIIVLETRLKLKKGESQEIKSKMDEYAKSRKEKQPIEYPSAGSTFKRGKDFITAKLIDEAGLKGYQIGGAQVSEKHAGFIINKGDATATDILNLIEYVKKEIHKKFDKNIELEVQVIGEK